MVKRQYNRSLLKQVKIYTKPNSDCRSELEKYMGKTLTIYGFYDRMSTTVLGETSICVTDIETCYGEYVSKHAWILLTPTSRNTYRKLMKCDGGERLRIYCEVRSYEDKRFGLATSGELWDPVDIISSHSGIEDNLGGESHNNPQQISPEVDISYQLHCLY